VTVLPTADGAGSVPQPQHTQFSNAPTAQGETAVHNGVVPIANYAAVQQQLQWQHQVQMMQLGHHAVQQDPVQVTGPAGAGLAAVPAMALLQQQQQQQQQLLLMYYYQQQHGQQQLQQQHQQQWQMPAAVQGQQQGHQHSSGQP
jgi:hypothetical protein